MATINSTIKLTDRMTGPLHQITSALNSTLDALESMKGSMNESFDNSKIEEARKSIASASASIINLKDHIEEAGNEQQQLNAKIDKGTENVGKLAMAFAGLSVIKKVKSWLGEAMDLSNIQTNAENQLKVVMKNAGLTKDAYNQILAKASQIQGKTIFGDEAMIAGAGELSTYVKDTNAIMSMMDTLSNYASGMTGGAEVGNQQMVDLATQLGKVLNGTFDGIAKKGFEVTDAQKKILKNGTDMQKAMVVNDIINESWDKLAENMAKTPQSAIIQANNNLGDMKELLGKSVLPYWANLKTTLLNGIAPAIKFVADNMDWLAPIFLTLATTLGVATAAMIIYKGVAWATSAANWAVLSPILLTAGAIIAIIGTIALLVKAYNKWTGSTVSTTGVIMGLFYMLGAGIYNGFIAPVGNGVIAFINFFANVWKHPIASVEILFLDLANNVVSHVLNMAKAIEKIINKIPGVKVDITSGLDNFKSKIENKIADIKDKTGYEEVIGKMNYWDYGDAFNKGYTKGTKFLNSGEDEWNPIGEVLDSIANDTDSISKNMNITSEDLKYLRDLAEQEAVNRFTEIKVELGGVTNNVSNNTDLDGMISYLVDEISVAIEDTARGPA